MSKRSSIKHSIRFFLLVCGSFIVACGPRVGNLTAVTMMYGGSQLYPSYEVTFRADGAAEFVSAVAPNERRTLPDNIGERKRSRVTGKILPEQLAHINEILTANGFSSMSSEHNPSTGGDLTTITAEFGQAKMEVSSQHGSQGPKFDRIKDAMEILIDQIEWTRIPD